MTSLGGKATAFGLLVLVAVGAGAQTLPLPGLPSPPATDPQIFPKSRAWEYALGTGVGWDSNLDFLVPDGPSELAVVPRGGLARIFWSPRGRLSVVGGGGLVDYPDERQLHRYRGDIGLDGEHRRSPTTRLRANVSYELAFSDSSRILLEQGVLLPLLVKTRSSVGGFGMTHNLGPRRSLRLDARYYGTQFDNSGLIDGESVRVTLGLERGVGTHSTVGLEYSVEDVLSDQVGRSYLTHFGSLQWTRILSGRSALLVEAGASYTPDAARAGLEHEENFFGGASFSRQVLRSRLRLFVRREVTPAFGLGSSRMEVRAGLGATVPIGADWEIRAVASHVQPENQHADERAYPKGDDAFAVLARRLSRRLEVSGELRYRRRGATAALPLVESWQARLFLTLQSPSWKSIAPPAAR